MASTAEDTKLVRKQILMTPRNVEKLDRLAKSRGASVAEIVRLAIDAYEPEQQPDPGADELVDLVSQRLKEAITQTQRTRRRLARTFKQLGQP